MSEWKYIDSIVELSDFECAHCDTRDFCMVVCDTIDEPWETLTNFLKKNQTVVEQCSFNKDEIIPLLKSLETASGGVGPLPGLAISVLTVGSALPIPLSASLVVPLERLHSILVNTLPKRSLMLNMVTL